MMEVISGVDPLDSTSVPEPVPAYEKLLDGNIKGLKLGLPKEYMIGGLDPEVSAAVSKAVEQLQKLGAETVEISLPHTDYAVATYYIVATAEASSNLARFDGIRYGARVNGADPIELYGKTRGAGFGAEVKRRIILGTYVLSSGYYDAYYLRAQKVRTLIRNDFIKAFEKVDAIVTPTTPTAAFKVGEKSDDPLQMYLSEFSPSRAILREFVGSAFPADLPQTQSFRSVCNCWESLLGKRRSSGLRMPTSRAPHGIRRGRIYKSPSSPPLEAQAHFNATWTGMELPKFLKSLKVQTTFLSLVTSIN